MSNFPDVFPEGYNVIPFDRAVDVAVNCNYCKGRFDSPETDVWKDIHDMIPLDRGTVPFTHWMKPARCQRNSALIISPYETNWANHPGDNFVPAHTFFMKVAHELTMQQWSVTYYRGGEPQSVKGWMNIYGNHNLIITQSSSHLVMAEAWDVKCLVIFNHLSLKSRPFVAACQPKKVIIKPDNTTWAYDNESIQVVINRVNGILKGA